MIYLWKCTICGTHEEVQRPIADHAIPPDLKPNCYDSCLWVRVFEAPMQMKASFPDGHKRKGWTDLKESARLEKAAAIARPETKREIKAEIRKMGIKPGTN